MSGTEGTAMVATGPKIDNAPILSDVAQRGVHAAVALKRHFIGCDLAYAQHGGSAA
jgi:hypothetical protein